MIVLPAERRRADAFARLLDERTAGSGDDDASFAAEWGPLTALAAALPTLDADMSPESSARIRRRLVAVAGVRVPEQRAAFRAASLSARVSPPDALIAGLGEWLRDRRSQLRLSVAAGVALLVIIAAAVGVAGNRSLPGDPLYGVKRATEAAQLTVTRGDLARGKLHFAFAQARLTEISGLLARDNGVAAAPQVTHPLAGGITLSPTTAAHVVRALVDMDTQTTAGTMDLTHAWQQSGATKPLDLLSEYSRTQFRQLNNTLPDLPVHAQRPARASLGLLVDVSRRADQLSALDSVCNASCRDGDSAAPGGVVIRGDALGALPCVSGQCPPQGRPAAVVTLGVGGVDPTTASLIRQLQVSANAYPEVVPTDPPPPAATLSPPPPAQGITTEPPSDGAPTSDSPTPAPGTSAQSTPSTPTSTPPTPTTPTPTPTTPTPTPTTTTPTPTTPTPDPTSPSPDPSGTDMPGQPTPQSAAPGSPAPSTSSPAPSPSPSVADSRGVGLDSPSPTSEMTAPGGPAAITIAPLPRTDDAGAPGETAGADVRGMAGR